MASGGLLALLLLLLALLLWLLLLLLALLLLLLLLPLLRRIALLLRRLRLGRARRGRRRLLALLIGRLLRRGHGRLLRSRPDARLFIAGRGGVVGGRRSAVIRPRPRLLLRRAGEGHARLHPRRLGVVDRRRGLRRVPLPLSQRALGAPLAGRRLAGRRVNGGCGRGLVAFGRNGDGQRRQFGRRRRGRQPICVARRLAHQVE